ncbi:MAG: hypothetical protein ACI9OJ_002609 [Myxococcota bacterium]|jgi:hypothetical protein
MLRPNFPAGRLLGTTVALCLFAAPFVASATPPNSETDAALNGKTVAVLPVLLAGGTGSPAWQQFGAQMALTDTPNAAGVASMAAAPATRMPAAQGFGFAGDTSATDLQILKYGYHLGLLPARLASRRRADARAAVQNLAQADHIIAGLDPDVRSAIAQVLEKTRANEISGAPFQTLMESANRGISSDTPRAYGYLMVGVWAGLAAYTSVRGVHSESLTSMVRPLVSLLEEDAVFASADRQIADTLLLMSRELLKRRSDPVAILRLGNRMVETEADTRG